MNTSDMNCMPTTLSQCIAQHTVTGVKYGSTLLFPHTQAVSLQKAYIITKNKQNVYYLTMTGVKEGQSNNELSFSSVAF